MHGFISVPIYHLITNIAFLFVNILERSIMSTICYSHTEISVRGGGGQDFRSEKKNLTLPQVIGRLPLWKQPTIVKRIIFLKDSKKESKEDINMDEVTIPSNKKHYEPNVRSFHLEFDESTTMKNHATEETKIMVFRNHDEHSATTKGMEKAVVFFSKPKGSVTLSPINSNEVMRYGI